MINERLLEMVDNADLSKREPSYDSELMSSAIYDVFYVLPWEVMEENFSTVWLISWLCTDTYVGLRAFYCKDEFIGVSIQTARKNYERFFWKDEATKHKLFRMFISYLENSEPLLMNSIDDDMIDSLIENKRYMTGRQ